MYRLRVADNGNFIGQQIVYCTIECFYIQSQNPAIQCTHYTIHLASINGYGDIGPENNVTISDFGPSMKTTGTFFPVVIRIRCSTRNGTIIVIATVYIHL